MTEDTPVETEILVLTEQSTQMNECLEHKWEDACIGFDPVCQVAVVDPFQLRLVEQPVSLNIELLFNSMIVALPEEPLQANVQGPSLMQAQ